LFFVENLEQGYLMCKKFPFRNAPIMSTGISVHIRVGVPLCGSGSLVAGLGFPLLSLGFGVEEEERRELRPVAPRQKPYVGD